MRAIDWWETNLGIVCEVRDLTFFPRVMETSRSEENKLMDKVELIDSRLPIPSQMSAPGSKDWQWEGLQLPLFILEYTCCPLVSSPHKLFCGSHSHFEETELVHSSV